MLTRILCATTIVALAGAHAAYAQQGRGGSGVFEWVADDEVHAAPQGRFHWVEADDDAPQRTVTIEKNEDTVLVFAPSAKGGTRISFSDGSKVIELRFQGNAVHDLEVIRDGQPQPGARAKIEADHIVVLSPSGEKLAQFSVPQEDGAKREITWHAQAQGGERAAVARARAEQRQAARGLRVTSPDQAPDILERVQPRRVIGITATNASDALAAQLGIEADKVIVIETVNEGMPAEKAGLKRFDIITKIDGSQPANISRLTEMIQKKGESDPLRLTIVRNGREQVIEVLPVAQGAQVAQGWEVEIDDEDVDFPFGRNVFQRQLSDEDRARVEEAMARAHEALAMQQERLGQLQERLSREAEVVGRNLQRQLQDSEVIDEVRRAYQEAISQLGEVNIQEQIERAMVEMKRAMEESGVQGELRSLPRIEFLQEGQNRGRGVIVAPTPPSPPAPPAAPRMALRGAAQDDSRLQALEERMARIERLLERIAEDRGN